MLSAAKRRRGSTLSIRVAKRQRGPSWASRQERRARDEHQERAAAERREDDVVAVCLAALAATIQHAPRSLGPAHVYRRLNWQEYAAERVKLRQFRNTFRMEYRSFVKLVEILRPTLERDQAFAGEL